MTDRYTLHERTRRTPSLAREVFGHPYDVVDHPDLSIEDKRAFLASWASDANAVPHMPSLRQLPDGSIVKVEDILRALKALDERFDIVEGRGNRSALWRLSSKRRRGTGLRTWSRPGHGRDDDDDPPPCPAIAAVRPKDSGGAAFACPEPLAA
jgi:hypothetical protein